MGAIEGGMQSPKIACLGTLCFDLGVQGAGLLWPNGDNPGEGDPAPGRLTILDAAYAAVGGPAAAAAVTAARLGIPARVIAGIGADTLGAILRGMIERHGVDSSGLIVTDASTSATAIPTDRNGVVKYYHAPAANAAITKGVLEKALHVFDGIKHLHIAGMGILDGLAGEGCAYLGQLGRDRGMFLSLDTANPGTKYGPGEALWMIQDGLPSFDVITISLRESMAFVGTETPEEVVENLCKAGARGAILVKMAQEGMYLYDGTTGSTVKIPAPFIEVKNKTGSGDASSLLFAHLVHEGGSASAPYAANMASKLGAIVACAGIGIDGVPHSLEEIEDSFGM